MSRPHNARAVDVDSALAALADPRRRAVVELLSQRPHAAGELADRIGLTPAAMSRQLRILRASGLVAESHPTFDARVRIYSLNAGPMADLRTWLADTETLWCEQLLGFKAAAEKAVGE